MAVSLRDRELSAKVDNIETRARYAWADIEGDWRAASARPRDARRAAQAHDSDPNFERVERLLYVGAALLVFIGSGIVVGSAFRGGTPETAEPVVASSAPQALAIAPPASAPRDDASLAMTSPPLAKLRSSEEPALPAAPLAESAAPAPRESVAPALMQTPAAMDVKDEGPAGGQLGQETGQETSQETAREIAQAAEPPHEAASRESDVLALAKSEPEPQSKTVAEGHMAKCFVKVSGRVLNSGTCRISRKGSAVTFQYSGQNLTISPVKGKTWALAVGGKKLGNIYKSGSCWGGKQTYICEKGV